MVSLAYTAVRHFTRFCAIAFQSEKSTGRSFFFNALFKVRPLGHLRDPSWAGMRDPTCQ